MTNPKALSVMVSQQNVFLSQETVFLYRIGEEGRQALVPETWQTVGHQCRLYIGKARAHGIVERTKVGENFEKTLTAEHVNAGEIFECDGVRMTFLRDNTPLQISAQKPRTSKAPLFAAIAFTFMRKSFLMAILLAAVSWFFQKSILVNERTTYDEWMKTQMRSLAQWNFQEEDERFPPPEKMDKKKVVKGPAPTKVLSPEERRIQLLERFDPLRAEQEKAKKSGGIK